MRREGHIKRGRRGRKIEESIKRGSGDRGGDIRIRGGIIKAIIKRGINRIKAISRAREENSIIIKKEAERVKIERDTNNRGEMRNRGMITAICMRATSLNRAGRGEADNSAIIRE